MTSVDPPRLYLNEHLSPRLADQLRTYGFDVTSSQEAGMLSVPDSDQLAHAVSEQRAIVTFNVGDYVGLHQEYQAGGTEHWGIIFSTVESVDVLRNRLLSLLTSLSAGDLKNQIRWLNDFK
jgi:hypothetical protein